MKNYKMLVSSALAAFSIFAGVNVRAVDSDNMVSLSINTGSEVVTLSPNWAIRPSLSGFHFMAQDMGLTGGAASQFYSLKGSALPSGDITGFTYYVPGSGFGTDHQDISVKLTNIQANSTYSGLTSADPDLGTTYGSVRMYTIHHTTAGDWLTVIKTSSATASAVLDAKPMSGPGGTGTGYFGLTFSALDLGPGANLFYYFRTDPSNQHIKFGSLAPALASAPADLFDLGLSGQTALAYTTTAVTTRYATNQMYFLRLDPITGYTIFGTLNPISGKASDMANLGSVYNTLTYVPGDVGFGSGQFYSTGTINPTWQSVSFAAIDDRAIATGPFTVNPTASSALAIALTVVPGSVGAASISAPVGGVFTVTPTAPGLITLQATQAGSVSKEYNMLRQSFTITGVATLAITTQPTSQSVVTGTTANFTVVASGTTALSYQWRKAGANISGNASATTATLSLTNAQSADAATYDVAVTNASGTIYSAPVTLTVTTAAPVITNSPLTAAGTVGTPFSFTITASNTPTSYSASPLPAGVTINTATGAITGTPSVAATTNVLLGATNATGTGNATLVITVAAAGVAPIITNSPLTAAGTVGTPFSFTITASGTPTSYSGTPLPAGLTINTTTGVITGTPTAVATTNVLLGATNAIGTGNATLVVTVAAAGIAPIITNSPLTAAGTVGTPFSFTITASGTPTSYSGTPLPAGLTINTTTGVITGTPTAAATTNVLLGATNAIGTGNATLVVTVAAAGVAPVITNSPLTAAGTVGTAFSFTITATGSPTSYSATSLPAGLTINTTTGAITGAPTAAGSTSVTLGATNGTGTGNATLVITIAAVSTAPVITNSPLTAAGTVGTPFSFTITATGSPISYAAIPLPAGLVRNATTGAITGTPTTSGTTSVVLGATNSFGTGNATLVVTISPAAGAPGITSSPLSAAGVVGTAFSFTITATGSPTSYAASPLPAGLVFNAATGAITGTPTAAGTTSVQLGATNATGTGNATFTITITAALVAPVITRQPVNQTVTAGQSADFTVAGGGERDPGETFLWQRLPTGMTAWVNLYEGGSFHGVTTATLTVSSPTPAMSGDQYRCVVRNATDFTTSNAVLFTVTDGTDYLFQYPATIVRDGSGNLYVADTLGNTIRKITPAGVVSTLAGMAGETGSQDGTGSAARFNHPDGVTVDAAGNLYVTDTGNATIRKITPAGVVTTMAGTANVRGSADAVGSAASFGSPTGIVADASGNLYVADTSNATIRKITSSGTVSTLAGSAGNTGTADGTGAAARFNAPHGVTVDAAGNVYVADTGNAAIRKITSAGVVTTLAGQPGTTGFTDGLGSAARFNQPYGLAVDATGNVYVADTGNDTIRAVTPGGAVVTLAGMPGIAGLNNGPGSSAQFNSPHGLAVNAGSVYVADTGNSTIRLISPTDVVSTLSMSVAPAADPAAPPPVAPITPITQPPASGGGGGGAIDPWFLALLVLIGVARLLLAPASRSRIR